MDHDRDDRGGGHGFFASRANMALMVFLAVAGYYLIAEHSAHLVGFWPLALLLLLCVGVHFFMHGGHGGGHGGGGDGPGGER